MGKIFRKLPVLALCVACVLGLSACSGAQQVSSSAASSSEASSSASASNSAAASSSSSAESDGLVPTDQIAIGEKALVVYYSATGNTANVATEVASATNADLYILEPTMPYTAEDLDYNNQDSRVYQQHADPTLQNVELASTVVPNWDSYDTVFLGYPLWWGEAAWPMDTFVKANDFTGKNVVCFCTSNSSGIGDSVDELRKLTTGGTWTYGERFPENATLAEVDQWVQTFILDMNQ